VKYKVDQDGFYGEFGGAFIPEMLHSNIETLKSEYKKITAEESFQKQFKSLLKDYVGRPSPLYYAAKLSATYGTNIYLKREDLNHTGAHKINNTIGQILLAQRLGKTRIIAETGAGQHGVATATVCALMGIECVVYMGKTDIKRQAPNVARMKMLGAKVEPALSGSQTLKDATNEAIRDWINNPKFQSVISEETKWQLKDHNGKENPDYIVACVGGGSNAAGAFYHYLDDKEVQLVLVEAAGLGIDSGESAATSVLGSKGIIHGSRTLLMQTEDGQIIEPYSISAGLDYPGIGPLHAHLIESNRAMVFSATDQQAINAAFHLTRAEGIIPALETAHAFAVLDQIEAKPDETMIICLSGRGDKDLATYISYLEEHEGNRDTDRT